MSKMFQKTTKILSLRQSQVYKYYIFIESAAGPRLTIVDGRGFMLKWNNLTQKNKLCPIYYVTKIL